MHERLPGHSEIGKIFANVDPIKEPIPVLPTIHYKMGGIRRTITARSSMKGTATPNAWSSRPDGHRRGSCVSVHGANRLGTNSLLDLVWCSAARRRSAPPALKGRRRTPLPANAATSLASIVATPRAENPRTSPTICAGHADACGVFRTGDMDEGVQRCIHVGRTRQRVTCR